MWKKTAAILCLVLVMTCGCGGASGETDSGAAKTEEAKIPEDSGKASTADNKEQAAAENTAASAGTQAAADAETGNTGSTSPEAAFTGETASAGRTGTNAAEYAAESRGLIVIDPGHQQYGNSEQEPVGPGASETKMKVSGGTSGVATGVPEYQLTLDIALQLRDVLEDSGYMVLMIRESNDVDISNAERAQMANDADADLFIRLHGDGSEDLSANGALAICQTPSNPYNSETYEDARLLAEKILDAYTEVTGIRSRGIQETDNMSGINWCSVPVTILEMGFMTNPDEDVKMQDPEFQKEMVSGIAKGIEDYLDEKNPNRVKPEENSAQMDTGSTAEEAETAPEEEPASEPEKQPENEQDSKDAEASERLQAPSSACRSSGASPACGFQKQSDPGG